MKNISDPKDNPFLNQFKRDTGKKKKIKMPEILAPAGSVEGMKAAFKGGADACYIGGSLFSARHFADNHPEKELLDCIDYAHLHQKKLYLTVNTLLHENELIEKLYDYLKPYYEEGIDGILVQDLGVMMFIKDVFPEVPIHASTQMTVCDNGAIEPLTRLGVKRIVLARELSIGEIAEFKKISDIELEVFVHGALCMCYSGQCLLSSHYGDRSANRGTCAQPCRLEYATYGNDKIIKGNKYPLSPKDLCGLKAIPDLIEVGVDSFKIEGRMKRPEYAALTSALYRKWTDIYFEHEMAEEGSGAAFFKSAEGVEKLDKAMLELADMYNRGLFTDKYYYVHNSHTMMASTRPNHFGVPVGKVTGIGVGKNPDSMKIHTDVKLHAHDVLEVRSDAEPDKPVYEFTLGEGHEAGSDFAANFLHGSKVERNMSVVRTKNETLLTTVKKHFIDEPLKRKVDIAFSGIEGRNCKITLMCGEVTVDMTGPMCERAATSPLSYEKIEEVLSKLGDTEFEAGNVDIMASNIFIPMSAFNEFRRKAFDELRARLLALHKRKSPSPYKGKMAVTVPVMYEKPQKLMFLVSSAKQAEAVIKSADPGSNATAVNMDLLTVEAASDIVEMLYQARFHVFLRLPAVLRAEAKNSLMNYFKSTNGKQVISRLSGFFIRSLEEYSFVRRLMVTALSMSGKFKLIADTNIYAMNSEAVNALHLIGINHYSSPIEQTVPEIRNVRAKVTEGQKKSERNFTVVVYGRQELMVTANCQWKLRRACKKNGTGIPLPNILYLENENKKENGLLPVLSDCENCTNIILGEAPISKKEQINEFMTLGAEYLRVDLTLENEVESEKVIKEYLACLR